MKTRNKLIGMFILILAAIATLIFSACSSSNELDTNKKVTSVLIMPTIKGGGIYFRDDQVWHNLVWSFKSNRFNVINNDSVWNSLINDGYDIARLTDAQILRIGEKYNVDLIISRNLMNGVFQVFDCKAKKFVVYENLNGQANMDVRSSQYSNSNSKGNNYSVLVMKVRGLGY